MTRRVSVLLILMLALALPKLWAAGTVVATIPIEIARNKTIVPVNVDGVPLRLILDTGMAGEGILIFHREKIDTSIGRWSPAEMRGAGPGGVVRAITNESGSFTVGNVAFEGQRIVVLDSDIYKGFPTDGVIGYSLLGRYAVGIDFAKKVLTLYDPDGFSVGTDWDSVPMYFKDNHIPWIDLMIATGDESPVRISAYIDSASGEALELLRREANKFTLPKVTVKRLLGRGLSGDIHADDGTISRMRIGPHELKAIRAAIPLASVRSRQRDADAIVGNGILARFHVIFDYAHERLHLRPNSHFNDPFE
ncbi:MAG: aspartyl protease family protein [Thermoanaerobaculia bacterium]